MTFRGIAALESLSQSVLGLENMVDDAAWARPSACPGWTNHDVLIHLVCTLREIVEPETLPAPFPGSVERTNDVAVAAYRSERLGQTFDTYRRLVKPAMAALGTMQQQPAASEVVDFDDAGSYPAHLVADSLVFDHYCHLRHDLAAPRGTVASLTIGADEAVMSASLAWLLAGLPQMSPRRLSSALTRPVVLFLDGPGGGHWTLVPSGDGRRITVEPGGLSTAGARIRATADSFHLWGTHRQSWHEADLDISGDRELARNVLDALHVI
ncbi:maleylpyruvate isomerase N-terminal domain-containing protein [Streptomyces himalayensis]|uniref:Maleylpyruvate isomerase N-terminal domain-containing protein n=1 Tax=Streptomyces himalayensis subsp. himalayensis TaxID=2756131 RepID=A0A7W0DL73_9ACTN|nr:maleylpyruvate isomerase N-terminal domain-containing protein [Streptomyces himalayensis]MBA2946755.1 maleylpyruvate isomerase N-terminal domain-containing protein [Streptomyces himalayensis subsp. himalayensis]